MRAYLARKPSSESWSGSTYDKLRLLGKTLTWTVDLSRVGCGCNAALYLVSMTQPDSTGSRYCDIMAKDPKRCLEIDLMEGNSKALATTLRTDAGTGMDGTCNQWGCASKWGPPDGNCKWGRASPNIDSSRPFELVSSWGLDGAMRVDVRQGGVSRTLWDVRSSGNGRRAVPADATAAVKAALSDGAAPV